MGEQRVGIVYRQRKREEREHKQEQGREWDSVRSQRVAGRRAAGRRAAAAAAAIKTGGLPADCPWPVDSQPNIFKVPDAGLYFKLCASSNNGRKPLPRPDDNTSTTPADGE